MLIDYSSIRQFPSPSVIRTFSWSGPTYDMFTHTKAAIKRRFSRKKKNDRRHEGDSSSASTMSLETQRWNDFCMDSSPEPELEPESESSSVSYAELFKDFDGDFSTKAGKRKDLGPVSANEDAKLPCNVNLVICIGPYSNNLVNCIGLDPAKTIDPDKIIVDEEEILFRCHDCEEEIKALEVMEHTRKEWREVKKRVDRNPGGPSTDMMILATGKSLGIPKEEWEGIPQIGEYQDYRDSESWVR